VILSSLFVLSYASLIPSVLFFTGKMGYEDFIVFFMSEEDKTTESALRFWFSVCDLDGDGVLTPADLRPFYRCESRYVEVHSFKACAR
jgi:Ca2+-binding EF-hand superfamily protein